VTESHDEPYLSQVEAAAALGYGDSVPPWLTAVLERYPARVPKGYLELAERAADPPAILRQCLPSPEELDPEIQAGGCEDPLHDQEATVLPRLVHRYPDRVLVLTTNRCALHCRHCFRKRLWREPPSQLTLTEWQAILGYLSSHGEIREVLLSGGDPFLLPRPWLLQMLRDLGSSPHVEVVRIGTRLPVAAPERFTSSFCRDLSGHIPLWIALHANHADELSPAAETALRNLARAGIGLVSQTVLLKGVNDDADAIASLCRHLLRLGVKPYYLLHADPVIGAMHFRTGTARGREIMTALRGNVSGLALPVFAADLADGGGKAILETGSAVGTAPDGRPLYRSFRGDLRTCD
jgi:lysine 2,3-aminomutase